MSASGKGVKVSFEITIPEITEDQLQFDKNPKNNSDRVLLGQGGFGRVYAGRYQGQPVAIKVLHLSTPKLVQALHQEAALMYRLASPHTVALRGIYAAPQETGLVMERMMGRSLFDLLQNDEQELPWDLRFRLAYETAEGIWALHQQGIVHRDLKSMNVLLDENKHAKITDFGFSKLKGQFSSISSSSQHSVGTPAYKAPEIVALDMGDDEDEDEEEQEAASAHAAPIKAAVQKKPDPYSPYSDVYAYGVIAWELVTRKVPFAGKNPVAISNWLVKGKTEKIPANCPSELAALIQSCWAMKPDTRPRIDQVVAQTKALYAATQAPVSPAADQAETKAEYEYVPAPWHMDPTIKPKAGAVKGYELISAGQDDLAKVIASYQRSPVPGYAVGRVQVVYNPVMNELFGLELKALNDRHENPVFEAKWKKEAGASGQWRKSTHAILEAMALPHKDPTHPHVTLLPMWHATNQAILPSLFRNGFVSLGTTDTGFFGRGIYSADEAKYSWTVYGELEKKKGNQPALLMNWVASYSAYPVIEGDKEKLEGRANFENYDAHFIPVRPTSPFDFDPCAPNQSYTYKELVVFNPRQCLARYVVELQSDLLPSPIILPQPKQLPKPVNPPSPPLISPPVQVSFSSKEDGEYKLRQAVKKNDYATVDALLKAGIHPDTGLTKDTPLFDSIQCSKDDRIFERLVQAGADIFSKKESNWPVVRCTIAEKIGVACPWPTEMKRKALQYLSTKQLSLPTILQAACLGDEAILTTEIARNQWSVTDNNGNTALHYAAVNGHISLCERIRLAAPLLMKAANKEDQTAMLLSAQMGCLISIQWLVSNGASVTEADTGLYKQTPLMLAAFGGHLSVLEWLYAKGAVNVTEADRDGKTPLMVAAEGGHVSVLEWLYSKGAVNVTEADTGDYKRTPLMYAAFGGHVSVLEWLYSKGAVNVTAKDKDGKMAIDLASTEDIKAFLQNLMIKKSPPLISSFSSSSAFFPAAAAAAAPLPEKEEKLKMAKP